MPALTAKVIKNEKGTTINTDYLLPSPPTTFLSVHCLIAFDPRLQINYTRPGIICLDETRRIFDGTVPTTFSIRPVESPEKIIVSEKIRGFRRRLRNLRERRGGAESLAWRLVSFESRD